MKGRSEYVLIASEATRKVVRRTRVDKIKVGDIPRSHAAIAVSKRLWKAYRVGDLVHCADWPEALR